MSHVTHIHDSCHTYEWVMSPAYRAVPPQHPTSHIRMSHVTFMNESCHTYKWVMSHIYMSHVTHMNESCHLHIAQFLLIIHPVALDVALFTVALGRATCLSHLRDMTHSYKWHDSFICVAWLIHMCDMTHSYVCHESCICVTWLIHMCDMTHSYVWHDSFICNIHPVALKIALKMQKCILALSRATCLSQMCDMTYSYVWHDSCISFALELCTRALGRGACLSH